MVVIIIVCSVVVSNEIVVFIKYFVVLCVVNGDYVWIWGLVFIGGNVESIGRVVVIKIIFSIEFNVVKMVMGNKVNYFGNGVRVVNRWVVIYYDF